VIRDVRKTGATIFLTTHDMVTADELCDRVAFLVDGAIAALDTPRSLRMSHGRRVVRIEVIGGGARTTQEFALEGLADNQEFLTQLRTGGVETIHTLETTLENVFIQVTGRTLA
jgi:fluoroquinolone transport system ATP-binding protein